MTQWNRIKGSGARCLALFGLLVCVGISLGCACAPAKQPTSLSEFATPEAVSEKAAAGNSETGDASETEEVAVADVDVDIDMEEEEEPPSADPFEKRNRKRFKRNRRIENCCVDPLAGAYLNHMPTSLQTGFRKVRHNLGEPLNLVNQFFQLRLVDATVSTTRFCVNTTVGLLGFYDPATRMGLKRVNSDTGETLYRYGVPKGPYLVLPLVGPSTVRDGFGTFVDFFLRPDTYLLTPAGQVLFVGGEGVVRKSEVMKQLEIMRRNSLDEYAMIRSAYLMDRMTWLRGRELTDEELDTLLYFE